MENISGFAIPNNASTSGLFGAGSHERLPFSLVVATICIALVSLSQILKSRKLIVNVPTEGSSGLISSYMEAYKFIDNAKAMLKDNYIKYKQGTFKIPGVDRYTVVINRPDLIEEIRKAPDHVASFSEASAELLAARWTIGENIARNHYHLLAIRNQLTRSLTTLFDDIQDEIAQSCRDVIPANSEEWVAIPVLDAIRQIVCRTSNRVFIGIPLCRNADYIDLNINYTIDVMKTQFIISKVPDFLRPVVGAFITTLPQNIRRGMKHLGPLLEERFRLYDEHGDDWNDKPADMLSWLIDEAPEEEKRSVYELTKRMLVVNFAAIHTSSNSFTHALFYLAAEPHYIAPLREEIERVIQEEGWTKVAMTKMRKLDSFMRESQRLQGINMLSLNRKILVDYTLGDGTFLPAGTFLASNLTATHTDDALYPDADVFDGFRFSKMRSESAEEGMKHQMVNTSTDYLSFGHGRHACPGRFFAVNELKAMMAYILLTYDVKAEVDGVRPENIYMGTRFTPNPKAKVMFKARK